MSQESTSAAVPPRRRRPRTPVGWLLREWRVWQTEVRRPRQRYVGGRPEVDGLLTYPIEMEPFLKLPHGILDAQGVPLNTIHGVPGGVHQPTSIAQYGLAHWNAYLRTREAAHLDGFLIQARWLMAHEEVLTNGAGVWPIPFPQLAYGATGPWLSALTQGNVLSVLVRAHDVTGDDAFLACARRAVHSFTLDILDGGVSAPVGKDGVFFEEAATYPAARILNGYLLALIGVYDYVRATEDEAIRALAERSVATLHALLDEYDAGYWTRYDLLHRRLASRAYHALHVSLLQWLTDFTGCPHCRALAAKWQAYERSPWCRLRYFVASRRARYAAALRHVRPWERHEAAVQAPRRVAVLDSTLPYAGAGNVPSLLDDVRQAMDGQWQIECLPRSRATRPAEPDNVPNTVRSLRAVRRALARLLRQRHFDLMLPLDSTATAACAASPAHKADVPLVVMDQGSAVWSLSAAYRQQLLRATDTRPLPQRLIGEIRTRRYLATLPALIRRGARSAERVLIADDATEKLYRARFGVPLSRIIRYPIVVRNPRSAAGETRSALGLDPDGMLIALVSQAASEQELDSVLSGIAAARRQIEPAVDGALRVLVVSEASRQTWLEAEIQRRSLDDICALANAVTTPAVLRLLRVGDIFLYTGGIDAGVSDVVLEAMAGGCAVVAATGAGSDFLPLAEGRGFAVASDDAAAISAALATLAADPDLRVRLGALSQEYVAATHSIEALRRALRRATGWAPVLRNFARPATDSASTSEGGSSQEAAISVSQQEQ